MMMGYSWAWMLNNGRWSHLLSLELPKPLTFSFAVLKLSSDNLGHALWKVHGKLPVHPPINSLVVSKCVLWHLKRISLWGSSTQRWLKIKNIKNILTVTICHVVSPHQAAKELIWIDIRPTAVPCTAESATKVSLKWAYLITSSIKFRAEPCLVVFDGWVWMGQWW